MRHFLLSILALMSASLVANAVISDDDKGPIFDADDGSITDPNPGHVFDESKNDDETAMFVRDYIQSNYIARSIPSPLDADYYLDLFKDNKLIPLVYNEAEGCYMCAVPVLDSEWKIYAKEYFETTDNSRDKYIYGTSEQYAPQGCGGSAYYMNSTEWRKMSNPGANCNIQIPQGSTNQNRVFYNCTLKFRPTSGDNWNGEFIMTGTQAGSKPTLAIEGVGTALSSFAGNVDFTIKPTGVYEPDKQTYTVVMSYTDRYGEMQSSTVDVTGLTGTFKNVAVLKGGEVTSFTLEASGTSLPVYNDKGQYDGTTQDLAATGSAEITTLAEPYIIGSIKGIEWSPTKLLTQVEDTRHSGYTKLIGEGTPLCEVNPTNQNAYTTLVWENVQFISMAPNTAASDVMRYRFVTVLPTSASDPNPWNSVNSGKQYFPKPGAVYAPNTVACVTNSQDKAGAATQECYNMISTITAADGETEWVQEWYDTSFETVTSGVETAWRADNKTADGSYTLPGTTSTQRAADEKLAYYVYLDMANGTDGGPRQAIYWNYTSDPTYIDDVSLDTANETPDVVDVYNMQGVCIRHDVPASQALDNLPEGIYIYDGHKYMVR